MATVLFLAILLAATKFRLRDADASINGQLDGQIILELALYVAVSVVVLVRSASHVFELPDRRAAGEYLLWAYAGWAWFSVFWSAAPTLTFVRAFQLTTILLLSRAIVRELGPSATFHTFSNAVIGFVVVCTTVGTLFPVYEFAQGDFNRFTWLAVHPISAATLLGLALVLHGTEVHRSRWQWRTRRFMMPAWLLCAVLGAALVITFSRGPLLACAVGLATIVLRRTGYSKTSLTLIAVLCVTSIFLLVSGDAGAFLEQHAPAFFVRGQDADALTGFSGRLNLWESMLPQILDHFGVGYGYQASRGVLLETAEWAGHAHNGLIQSMLDLGIVGTILLLSCVATLFRSSSRPGAGALSGTPLIPLLMFLLVNSVSNEGIAAAPGVETLALFISVVVAQSPGPVSSPQRRPAPQRSSIGAPA